MTTASSCCEGVARNQTAPPPDQLPVASQGARPVLLSQTRTTLNVREDKGRPPERSDRRDLTYPNRTIAA
ncbi:hypothetical protein V6N13_109243 [Hibiscus sabdariffa]|uniref:Uncharacterized protein n=2 Tax=Malvoideae TaxID=214907 RepID=A0ABR0M9X0_GOSAR|nr:hypothetical protein PVK06_049953 [Gossypium arboreum]